MEENRRQRELGEPFAVAFAGMDLSKVDLGGEYLGSGIFYETDLTGARLDGASLRAGLAGGLILRQASCCGTDFFKAGLEGSDFTEVLGHGIYFAKAELARARFDRGSFWHGDFTDSFCDGASFVGADLSLCSFRGASLEGADLRGVQLGWADFTGAFLDTETRLAGAQSVAHAVSADMIRYEGEKLGGEAAKELLIQLTNQPDE